MTENLAPVLTGFAVSIGLIAAIGAQNLFVLKQSISGQHAALAAFICFACDAILMSMGVLGLGQIIKSNPWATPVLAVFGSVFLLAYGLRSLRSAIKGGASLDTANGSTPEAQSVQKVAGLTLAITLLNPHVYLDTVVLVGSISTTFVEPARPYFLLGAATASFTWFFAIALAGKMLRPLFKAPLSWRLLDAFSAMVMFWVSWQLAQLVLQ